MNISDRRQSQFELFPGASASLLDLQKPRYPFRELTIVPENMIVVFIVLLMMFILSFSFGIERGKWIQSKAKTPEKIIAIQNKNSAIMPPQSQPEVNAPSAQMIGLTAVKTGVVTPKVINQATTPVANQPVVEPQRVEPKVIKGKFTIQVASFKSSKTAQFEAANLKGIGFDTFVMPKGSYSIVCVGKFMEQDDAEKYSNKLKSRYKEFVVRRL